MGYYVRVFCTVGEPPVLRPVLTHAAKRGSTVTLDPQVSSSGLDNAWDQVGVLYKAGRLPILLEINREDADQALMKEEIEEFMDLLQDSPKNADRERVERHLRETKFTVAAQLATDDIDDDGYNALGNVLTYFVEHHGGMIQADGEGFYDGEKVIVEV